MSTGDKIAKELTICFSTFKKHDLGTNWFVWNQMDQSINGWTYTKKRLTYGSQKAFDLWFEHSHMRAFSTCDGLDHTKFAPGKIELHLLNSGIGSPN